MVDPDRFDKIAMAKKAQMEILGIAVVILIIIVGLLLMIMLISPFEQRSVIVDVARTEMGANTLNTLLKTNTGCRQMTVSELITDCVDGPNADCSGADSCEYAKTITAFILKQTLTAWRVDYQYNVLVPSGADFEAKPEMNIQTRQCTQKDHFEQPIPTHVSMVKVSLDLCR